MEPTFQQPPNTWAGFWAGGRRRREKRKEGMRKIHAHISSLSLPFPPMALQRSDVLQKVDDGTQEGKVEGMGLSTFGKSTHSRRVSGKKREFPATLPGIGPFAGLSGREARCRLEVLTDSRQWKHVWSTNNETFPVFQPTGSCWKHLRVVGRPSSSANTLFQELCDGSRVEFSDNLLLFSVPFSVEQSVSLKCQNRARRGQRDFPSNHHFAPFPRHRVASRQEYRGQKSGRSGT